jgi:hypothetical protein
VSDSVTLAYLHSTEVAHSFHDSLVNLLLFDAANEQRILRGGYIAMRCGTNGVPEGRNKTAEAFLDRDADWLFVVDTDMGFAPDTLERLLDAADPVERPIVGALCFAWREVAQDGLSGFRTEPRPTVFDYVKLPDGTEKFMGRSQYPLDELVRCAGTGSACILIHRSVIEKLEQSYGPTWYDRVKGTDGSMLGEDISFCVRATACGFPIHVHTGVKTSHLKNVWVSEVDYIQFLALKAAADQTPPPADEIETVTVDELSRVPVHEPAD